MALESSDKYIEDREDVISKMDNLVVLCPLCQKTILYNDICLCQRKAEAKKPVQCQLCQKTILYNDICLRQRKAEAKKPFTCPNHPGISGSPGILQKHISSHLSPPINVLCVKICNEMRTLRSGTQIFSYLVCLTTFFMLMSVGDTVPVKGCPPPDYIFHENGFCCGVVSCKINHTVSMCTVKYGNDTCRPCEDESFLLDPTTSATATGCVTPVCDPNITRPTLVKSTTIDQHACPQWCECDLRYSFCGTDPCNCRKVICPFHRVLQQDCGCRPIAPSTPKPIPSKEIRMTKRSFTTSKPQINVTTESSALPVVTLTPASATPFPLGTTTEASASQSSIIIALTVTAVAVIAAIIVFGIYWYRRKNSSVLKKEPRHYHYHNHNNVHVEKADVIQTGKNSVTIMEQSKPEERQHLFKDLHVAEQSEDDEDDKTEVVIENYGRHTEQDLSMDGPKSLLSGNMEESKDIEETYLKSVKDSVDTQETYVKKVKPTLSDKDSVDTEETYVKKVKPTLSDKDSVDTEETYVKKVKPTLSDNDSVDTEETYVKKVKPTLSDKDSVDTEETYVKKVKPALSDKDSADTEETYVKKVKPALPDANKRAPLVNKEDTRLGTYIAVNSQTNGKTVVSGSRLPDSRPKQQNGVGSKESNGHITHGKHSPFKGFTDKY